MLCLHLGTTPLESGKWRADSATQDLCKGPGTQEVEWGSSGINYPCWARSLMRLTCFLTIFAFHVRQQHVLFIIKLKKKEIPVNSPLLPSSLLGGFLPVITLSQQERYYHVSEDSMGATPWYDLLSLELLNFAHISQPHS